MDPEKVAESALDEIFDEANYAIAALIESSDNLLPLLLKRRRLLESHANCDERRCVSNFEWPSVGEFSVELMTERIREFVVRHCRPPGGVSINVECSAQCSMAGAQPFHFRSILTKPRQQPIFADGTSDSFVSSIYFLVEISPSAPSASAVEVSCRFVNPLSRQDDTHSRGATAKYASCCR